MRHSQRTREKPLQVWVIILLDGGVSSAHCTCMAGLSEACSHVAAILFFLEARPTSTEVSCTETLSQWPIPSTKSVDMVRIRDMDWSRKTKSSVSSEVSVPPMETEEVISMVRRFEEINISSAIARVFEPFATEMHQPPKLLPNGLEALFDVKYLEYSYQQLLAEPITLNMSIEDIKSIELDTREQAQNNIWFKYRAGRITASKFKSVCRASLERPPLFQVRYGYFCRRTWSRFHLHVHS